MHDGNLDIGTVKQVFIDGRFIESSQGIQITPHRPRKTGEMNIAREHTWECVTTGYASVVKVGDTYHMWYVPVGVDVEEGAKITQAQLFDKPGNRRGHPPDMIRSVCYARSEDGIRWVKPFLGLTHNLRNNHNNIVIGYGAGGIQGSAKGAVSFNSAAPEDERFCLFGGIGGQVEGLPGGDKGGLTVLVSEDGIHWRPKQGGIITDREQRHLDTLNLLFWDDRIGKHVAYLRKNPNPEGLSQFRTISRAEAADLDSFPDVADTKVVLRPDRHDPCLFRPTFGHPVPIVDYYTSMVTKCRWAQDAYFVFPSAYWKYDSWFLREFESGAPTNAGPVDIRFGASRDGITWQRFGRRAFVPLGMKRQFDAKALYMA